MLDQQQRKPAEPRATLAAKSQPNPVTHRVSGLGANQHAASSAPFLPGVPERFTASPLKFDSGFSSTRSSPPPPSSSSGQHPSSQSGSSSIPYGVAISSRSLSESPPETGSPPRPSSVVGQKPVTAKSHLAETSSSEELISSDDVQAAIVDYKEPRPLHKDFSPPALSTYEEPVWQVVQDMREQRMSLCQSLRQYVFVHAALIEGALMIVDDERPGGLGKGSPRPIRPKNNVGAGGSGSTASQVSSSGKRGASPTELLKKDKAGEVSMSKRPSVKRKQSSAGGREATFATSGPSRTTAAGVMGRNGDSAAAAGR